MMNSRNAREDKRQIIASLCEQCLQSIVSVLDSENRASRGTTTITSTIESNGASHVDDEDGSLIEISCRDPSSMKFTNHFKSNDTQHHANKTNQSSRSPCHLEIHLWAQLKKYIGANETVLVSYIHGFYAYLLQIVTLLLDSSCGDMYFMESAAIGPLHIVSKPSPDDFEKSKHLAHVQLLLYNVNIRLGDLNRYLKNIKMARHYYLQAREINPSRGHAYNQLALVSTSDVLETLYFSVRASLATQDPVKNAEDTIKSLVKKSSLINPNIGALFSDNVTMFEPNKVSNWLRFIVLAVYCEKFKLVLPHLVAKSAEILQASLDKTSECLRLPNDDKWLLSALDVMFDAIHIRISDERLSSVDYENDFHNLVPILSFYSDSLRDDHGLMDETHFSLPLRHDFILYGFAPLKSIHETLKFDSPVPSDELNMKLLINRLCTKLDLLEKTLCDKKAKAKTKRRRNIALQSILGSKGTV
ncbi:uncharacterized protein LOC141849494 [Brevipalpus obovatus]|uniref:uncharacterized protein LOC141849494 n=1 Tax=Brevipalpus obovatus TaxID=246614 RepID=UPI003D9FAA04